MKRTTRRIFIGLAIVLLFGLTTGVVHAGHHPGGTHSKQMVNQEQGPPVTRPFKLRAAGQIDLSTGVILFGGVATHVGLYTANGFLLPDQTLFGTLEAANGDTLDFTAFFMPGPLGLQATFNFAGGTGRFADAVGTASGPVILDPDFMFSIVVVGDLDY